MIDDPESATIAASVCAQENTRNMPPAFFGRTDWWSFGLATVIALVIYLYTLAPEVTLEWSGMYATGAMYGGGGPPPGFPTWTLYAWVFTKILPFSNIAWRISVSSAVAGATLCGMIALMVSRGSTMILRSTRGLRRLNVREESRLRLVCGLVAGLGFGFHRFFWYFALVVESEALGLLLLSFVLCLLLRWAYCPRQSRFLYAAVFLYGLTLTVRLSAAALAPALPLMVFLIKPDVGRDLFAFGSCALGLACWAFKAGRLPMLLEAAAQFNGLASTYLVIAIVYALVSTVLIIRSRRVFTRWRAVLAITLLLFCGWSVYFYTIVASTTNPPANWAYARSPEGFFHLIARGQYERLYPMNLTKDPARYLDAMWHYSVETVKALSWVYVVPAFVPFFFLHKVRGRARRWLLGLLGAFFALSFFMLVIMNPPPDGYWSIAVLYFTASHLMLTIWAGYGLVLLGTLVAQKRRVTVGTGEAEFATNLTLEG